MPPKARTITASELEIMKLLWPHGEMTAKELRERLYPEGTASDTATVQKLLQRLEGKGMVERDRSEFVHRFKAGVSRSEILGYELQSLAENMLEGSLVPVLTQLLKKHKLSSSEKRELQKLLEEK